MSQFIPSRELRFFLTAPQPCPYLPGHLERKVFAHLPLSEGAAVNDALTLGGFRRSQNIAYRPACPGCDACVSARIPVEGHAPSRSERRIIERNADLTVSRTGPEATSEQFDLLRRYLDTRHAGGGMAGMSWPDYVAMVEDTAVRTHIIEYRLGADAADPGKLVACVLVDVLSDGCSLVYSFFDPHEKQRSLGSLIILDHIARARAAGLAHVYLGYWVRGSEKMAYKARFSPLEILRPEGWRAITPAERALAMG